MLIALIQFLELDRQFVPDAGRQPLFPHLQLAQCHLPFVQLRFGRFDLLLHLTGRGTTRLQPLPQLQANLPLSIDLALPAFAFAHVDDALLTGHVQFTLGRIDLLCRFLGLSFGLRLFSRQRGLAAAQLLDRLLAGGPLLRGPAALDQGVRTVLSQPRRGRVEVGQLTCQGVDLRLVRALRRAHRLALRVQLLLTPHHFIGRPSHVLQLAAHQGFLALEPLPRIFHTGPLAARFGMFALHGGGARH